MNMFAARQLAAPIRPLNNIATPQWRLRLLPTAIWPALSLPNINFCG